MKLVRLPEKLGDYVILHELLHTRIKNHGKKFWRELDKIVDNPSLKVGIFGEQSGQGFE
jgi:hypothetical protein